MADAVKHTLNLEFPDEQTKEDFEIAFRGWLKQYQQQATLQRQLSSGGGGQQPGGAQPRIASVSAYLNVIPGW